MIQGLRTGTLQASTGQLRGPLGCMKGRVEGRIQLFAIHPIWPKEKCLEYNSFGFNHIAPFVLIVSTKEMMERSRNGSPGRSYLGANLLCWFAPGSRHDNWPEICRDSDSTYPVNLDSSFM